MATYTFRKEIEIGARTNSAEIDPDLLGEAIEKAEEHAYRKLYDEVSRHFINFSLSADIKLIQKDNKAVLNMTLTIGLEISPLTSKITEQNRIAKEIADAFFETIKQYLLRVLEKTNRSA